MKGSLALFALSSVSLVAFSAAAEDVPAMQPVVVVATRADTPLNEIASSVTVISREQIERENKPEVADLLRQVPGLTVANNGGVGQTTRVFMRGTNSNHVLVMMDGVRLNDPSDPGDAFDFANLNTDNIERIEVLRGPQSTLYGSEAIGGVINIISKKGAGAPKATAFAEYGRYNTSRAGVGSSGQIGDTRYSFEATNRHSNGISAFDKKFGGTEKDGNEVYTFSGNVASKLSDNFTAKMNARYSRVETEFDSLGTFTRPLDDAVPDNDSRQFSGRVSGELSLFDGRWVQELGASTLNLNRGQITVYYDSLGNELFGRQEEIGARQTVDWVNHVKLTKNNLFTFGGEIYSDRFKTQSLGEVNNDDRAVFADDQITYGDFFTNVAVREDFNQAYGDQFTWKVAPGYRIEATGTTLKATYGTAFKAPSLSQLYDPSYGNPLLHPEKSTGWDAGFEQSLLKDTVVFGATAFRNDITQLIFNANTPPFAPINIGKARTEGVESTATFKPFKALSLTLNHTYTLAENRSQDKELLRRPRHMVDAGANYQLNNAWDFGARARYSSSRRDIDINFPYGTLYVKSYTVVDLNADYRFNSHVTFYGRVDNLLDKRYEEVYAYGQPGLSVFGGVKLAY